MEVDAALLVPQSALVDAGVGVGEVVDDQIEGVVRVDDGVLVLEAVGDLGAECQRRLDRARLATRLDHVDGRRGRRSAQSGHRVDATKRPEDLGVRVKVRRLVAAQRGQHGAEAHAARRSLAHEHARRRRRVAVGRCLWC